MKFDDLDEKMRVYETASDFCVLPGVWMVARLDGRGFTKMTKNTLAFEAPFDERFRVAMHELVSHLMTNSGFAFVYGYHQSDEISLLFPRDDHTFGRKLRKLVSILAGEASAKLSLALGTVAAFDARISQLPSEALVIDYFRWRHADAARNCLNAHCHWALIRSGLSPTQATKKLSGLSKSAKHDLLFGQGINFAALPGWQRGGTGFRWEQFDHVGCNPVTGSEVIVKRRRLITDDQLPLGEAYSQMLENLVRESVAN
jgi:tRNA(His) 5'-end guanylyltransferase